MTDKSEALNRRYELSFKRQMVAETFVEGVTIAAVARRHELDAKIAAVCPITAPVKVSASRLQFSADKLSYYIYHIKDIMLYKGYDEAD